MDDPSKPSPPPVGERSGSHPRPFFYVQPAVQPFYTYQWQMNHPFSQHGFHGSAFHFSRPYMFPYSYLQYPGYVMPHSALPPMDYRRIQERNFVHAPGCDAALRQYQHGPGAPRETTCVGAQTDPSEALNKLLECLDQLRASDGSQTSGSSSPAAKEPKREATGESNAADNDRDTSCRHASQGDDSSLASEREERELAYRAGSASNSDASLSGSSRRDEKVQDEADQANNVMDGCGASRPPSQLSPVCSSLTRTDEDEGLAQKPQDVSCCILHLPIEKVLSSSVYGSSITPPSLGSPLSYTYRPPQLAHGRVSVLSPSLDELSSHDELLSTDLDDLDLFPSRICARGKLAGVTSRRCHGSDLCLLCPKRLTCAMCGSHTFKELSRKQMRRYDSVDDSDEIQAERRLRHTPGKSHSARKTHSLFKHKLRAERHREKAESQRESEHLCCEMCVCSAEKSSRGAIARSERRCRATPDQPQRDARAQTCTAQPLPQRPQRLGQRKGRSKLPACQSSRNQEDDNDENEEEELQYHRTKGTAKRGGARC